MPMHWHSLAATIKLVETLVQEAGSSIQPRLKDGGIGYEYKEKSVICDSPSLVA